MKTIYFIRHAKSKDFERGESDCERSLKEQGFSDIKTIGNYLKIREEIPELILSSSAFRAQQTAMELAKILEYKKNVEYFDELYKFSILKTKSILEALDDDVSKIFVIGHGLSLTELINGLIEDHISKFPTMGVAKVDFDIDSWSKLEEKKGSVSFFIYPKQFKYYMPKQIRTHFDFSKSLSVE